MSVYKDKVLCPYRPTMLKILLIKHHSFMQRRYFPALALLTSFFTTWWRFLIFKFFSIFLLYVHPPLELSEQISQDWHLPILMKLLPQDIQRVDLKTYRSFFHLPPHGGAREQFLKGN